MYVCIKGGCKKRDENVKHVEKGLLKIDIHHNSYTKFQCCQCQIVLTGEYLNALMTK